MTMSRSSTLLRPTDLTLRGPQVGPLFIQTERTKHNMPYEDHRSKQRQEDERKMREIHNLRRMRREGHPDYYDNLERDLEGSWDDEENEEMAQIRAHLRLRRLLIDMQRNR